MSWHTATLGQVITTRKGFAFKSSEYVETGIPIVRVSDYTTDSISSSNLKYYPIQKLEKYLDFILRSGDILIQTVGSWQNNPQSVVGKVVRVPPKLDGALLNQNAVRVSPAISIDNDYLYYRLKNADFGQYVLGKATGAANQASITLETIKSFRISYPGIDVQRRIASILMAYDNLIENNRRQIALLEEAAQRLYKEWLDDLRYPTGEASADRTSWTQLPLTECAKVIRGRSYTSDEIDGDEGVALVNLKNLRSFGGWNDGAEKTYSGAFKEEQRVSAGDIIMGVTDMTKERRLVGHVALVPELEREAIISMDLVKLVPVQVENLYLYAHLRFSGIAENIALLANGTNVLHLKPQILSSVQIPIPSQNLQTDFARHMEPMVSEINICSKRIASAQEARDRLLPKLMSGEIEVEG